MMPGVTYLPRAVDHHRVGGRVDRGADRGDLAVAQQDAAVRESSARPQSGW